MSDPWNGDFSDDQWVAAEDAIDYNIDEMDISEAMDIMTGKDEE